MSDKYAALKQAAEKARGAHDRLSVIPPDDIFDISLHEGAQLDSDITDMNNFNDAATPPTILELLAERDADKARIAELEKWVRGVEESMISASDRAESAEKRVAELEARNTQGWVEHDGKWRPDSLGKNELVYLKTRKQELKIPYPSGIAKGWTHSGDDMDILAYRLAEPKGEARTLTVKLPDYRATYKEAFASEVDHHVQTELEKLAAAAGISLKIEGE